MSAWRAPHTMPENGKHCICAYRWGDAETISVAVGHWFKGDATAGVVDAASGCYIPCVGWMPMPDDSKHEPWIPLHLRKERP